MEKKNMEASSWISRKSNVHIRCSSVKWFSSFTSIIFIIIIIIFVQEKIKSETEANK